MSVVLGFIAIFLLCYFNCSANLKDSETGNLEKVCNRSNTLTVAQVPGLFEQDGVRIVGIGTAFVVGGKATNVANELCAKYGFKVINAEGASTWHLSKI